MPRSGEPEPSFCDASPAVEYSIPVDAQAEPVAGDDPDALAPVDRGRPAGFRGWLYSRLFRHVRIDERWSGAVRDSARAGVVVYVMRTISILDFLCLDFLISRFALPRLRFVNDLRPGAIVPRGSRARRFRLFARAPGRALRELVGAGNSALIFLRKPALRRGGLRGGGVRPDVEALGPLIAAQRGLDRPIFIVPQTFVWGLRPPKGQPSVVDLFFGTGEDPGRLRTAVQFLFNRRNARLRSGAPFDLQRFLEANEELTDAQLVEKLRFALLQRIERERRLVLGPVQKTPERIMDELLRSPRMQPALRARARESGQPMVRVKHSARRELRHLCANQQGWMIAQLGRFLGWLFHRIYDGTVVDTEGLERVRAAGRRGTLVYLPSHKSHVDYLVLSYVLNRHDLQPPLIAAGENLSFWPLGPILRRGGAYFIKRSFRGDKLYAALVDAYVRKLLVEGFPVELFVEGGRSRTGKLLAPKYGILSMIVDAALKLRLKTISFVPVSIGYERVIEEGSYLRELTGGEKKKEDVGGLIRSGKVLRSRYGRLYVQFGEVLSFDELLAQQLERQGVDDRRSLSASGRRALIQRLAHRVTYEIDRATVVTPAALVASALMAPRRRGVARGDLYQGCAQLLEVLARKGARIAPVLRGESAELRESAVDEALALFVSSRLVRRFEGAAGEEEPVFKVPSERRLSLEYYKNNIVHFFVPSALIAAAFRGEYELPFDELAARVRELSRVFKHEFMFRADTSFAEIFDDEVAAMEERGELVREGERVRAPSAEVERVRGYAGMIDGYFDAYRLALRCARGLVEEGATTRKEWVRRALLAGQRSYLAGEIDRREALSKPKLEMALELFKERGLVKFVSGEQGAWVEGDASEASYEELRALLDAHLDRR